jgi:hypothetical protein
VNLSLGCFTSAERRESQEDVMVDREGRLVHPYVFLSASMRRDVELCWPRSRERFRAPKRLPRCPFMGCSRIGSHPSRPSLSPSTGLPQGNATRRACTGEGIQRTMYIPHETDVLATRFFLLFSSWVNASLIPPRRALL